MSSNIVDSIQEFAFFIYESFNNNISSVLDKIVFIKVDMINNRAIFNFNGKTAINVIEKIANTFLYGILIYIIFKYLISKITNDEVENISSTLYKVIIAAILIGFSSEVCNIIFEINGYITDEILRVGKILTNKEISFDELFKKIYTIISYKKSKDASSVNGILQGFVSFGLINLILVYSLRYIYIKVLSILIPFAIIFKTNRKTEYISKAWLKSFIGLLFLQHLIAIILILAISIKNGDVSLHSKVICVGCVYALMQVNELQREIIGSSSLYINTALRAQKGGI